MINYFKIIKEKAERHKTLIHNFSYLSVLQIFNMLLPLITYPYLIRILGAELFGTVIFAQSVITYFSIIINFGFNISATKDVSINRHDKAKLSEIVSSVLINKFILWVISLISLFIFLIFIYNGVTSKLLFLFAFGICFNELLFPIWYFQGIEKMKYITYINLTSRILFLGLIFLMVKVETDYLYVPLFNGIGAFIGGLISLYIVFFNEKIKFKLQPLKKLIYYVKESLPLFGTRIAAQIYTNTTTIVIGLILSKTDVAYFDLANKISSIVRIPITIFSQTIFPKVSKDKNINFVKMMLKYSLILAIIMLTFLMFFVKYPVLFLGGCEMLPSINITRILLISIIPIVLSTFFGTQILVSFNYAKSLSESMFMASFFYLLLLTTLFLFNLITLFNMAILVVLNESFLAVYQYIKCKKHNLL